MILGGHEQEAAEGECEEESCAAGWAGELGEASWDPAFWDDMMPVAESHYSQSAPSPSR